MKEKAKKIGAKILSLRKKNNLTQSQLAKKLGLTTTAIQNYERGENFPSLKNLFELSKIFKIPISYFLEDYDDDLVNYFLIPLLQARVSAGGGSVEFNYIEDKDFERYAFRKDYIKRVATSPDNLFLTRVMGDSMYPTLKDGDIVLVDRGKKQVQDNKIYVVRAGDEVYIKRLIKIPTGTIKVKSDNPNYPEYEIKADEADFEVVGKVIWAGVNLE